MYSTRWQCIYRCTVTRGFQLMNIQSTRGKVLIATAALISLIERCQSVNRQQSLIFLGGGRAKRSKDGDDGEACEWWRNLWTVLQYWQAESVKYDTCFQKSPYLPWRLKFGHLRASGYQIYFSVYRVAPDPRFIQVMLSKPLPDPQTLTDGGGEGLW